MEVTDESAAAFGDTDEGDREQAVLDAIRDVAQTGKAPTERKIRDATGINRLQLKYLLAGLLAAGKLERNTATVQGQPRDTFELSGIAALL